MIHFICRMRRGEIVLVIIGILVALHLNDLSDAHKERARELAYLRKIA